MCFCLSGCTINWWTHRSSLAFSFTALNPIFSGCFGGFPCVFLLDFILEAKVLSVVFFPTSLTFLEFLFPSFGIFPLFFKKKFQPDRLLFCVYINPSFPPALLFLFLPFSSVPHLLVCGFWAMLSSPTVILQPYGLPVYPQATTCYPSIVQVNLLIYSVARHYHINTENFPLQENIPESIYWGTITLCNKIMFIITILNLNVSYFADPALWLLYLFFYLPKYSH